ncbi:unnamed protein product, partial [Rhizoctonia solani]
DSAAIDAILRELVVCVKTFKCPSGLDFSSNPTNPVILASTEPNKPFINQLRKLHGLQSRIQISGNEQLMKKHRATPAAVAPEVQKMKKPRHKLHQKFTASAKEATDPDQADDAEETGFEVVGSSCEMAADAAIDRKLRMLVDLVKSFKFPSELDFSQNNGNPTVLINKEKNQPFINSRSSEIQAPGNKQLESRYKVTQMAIEADVKRMREHQFKLHEKFTTLVAKTKEAKEHLGRLKTYFNCYVKIIQYPPQLDFRPIAETHSVLDTARNKSFIDHLPLQNMHRDIGGAIGQSLQRAKKHRLDLYEQVSTV